MLGCTYGTLFKTTVAGGSYQEGLSINIQGVPPGYHFTEEEIYVELMLRKPGQGELTSPRREADVPIIFSGVNAADTMPGYKNAGYTNGTPMVILIPNVDRHFEHIEQYQLTNRTPRPGHASYASYQKYGSWDDSIGAGFFSGRYTSSIVAAGCIAKKILIDHGIEVVAFVREAAGIEMKDMPVEEIKRKAIAYREVRKQYDPIYLDLFASGKMKNDMRFFEKAAILADLEKRIPDIKRPVYNEQEIREKYSINPKLFCPDAAVADAMYAEILRIMQEGFRKYFYGYIAFEAGIIGLENGSHSTLGNLSFYFVTADFLISHNSPKTTNNCVPDRCEWKQAASCSPRKLCGFTGVDFSQSAIIHGYQCIKV